MIRQDYFMRMVQEMVQVLARVLSLKRSCHYQEALREIEGVLARLCGGEPGRVLELGELIGLCRQEGGPALDRLVPLADLLRERGELLAREHRVLAAQQSNALALGLCLESLQEGRVSMDLLDRIGLLIAEVRGARLPEGLPSRLLAYLEARGLLGQAEDVLFDWLGSGDPAAIPAGHAFYERLSALGDEELARGNLPRAEVEQGRAEFQRLTVTGLTRDKPSAGERGSRSPS